MKIDELCNKEAECALPLDYIFYQHTKVIEGMVQDINKIYLSIELPEEIEEQYDYSMLQRETSCKDDKMLVSLLNFPIPTIQIHSKGFQGLKQIHTPYASCDCSFHLTGAESKELTKKIIRWCKIYGYPFRLSECKQEINLALQTKKRTGECDSTDNHIMVKLYGKEFMFKLWKLKECLLLLDFYTDHPSREKYNQFSENMDKKSQLPYEYYHDNYIEILKNIAEQINFSTSLSFKDDKSAFFKVITESPFDTAFYQLFLIYLFKGDNHRIRQCQYCGKFFKVKNSRSRYCDNAACNRKSYYAAKHRKNNKQKAAD